MSTLRRSRCPTDFICMQPLSVSNRQRAISNQQLRTMIALGFGSSLLLHAGLIVGIAHWWHPSVDLDEPIEITLVEPTEIEPIAVASQPVAKPPKISITNPPAQVARPQPTVLKSVSKPVVVTPAPKSVAVVVKPISEPRTTAQPQPKSSSIPTKVKPSSRPLQTAKVNPPVNTNSIGKPFPIVPKTATSKPVQTTLIDNKIATPSNLKSSQNRSKIKTTLNSPFTSSTQQPPQNTPVPRSWDRSISQTPRSQPISPPIPVQPNDRAAAIPKSPPATSPDVPTTPVTTPDLSSPMSPPSQTRSTKIAQPPAGGNIPNNDRPIPSQYLSPGGGLTGKGSRSGSSQAGSPQAPNSSQPSGNGDARPEGSRQGVGGAAPGGDASSPSQTASGGGLQCIERCQISKLRDLQDRDGGKDRLRIRIVIEPNGSVLEATIAKSSDNPQIDAIVLAGIKQMQFKPPGKIIKGIIKANILL